MQILSPFKALKLRLADASGAVTEEYVLTSVLATGIVTVLVKLLESSLVHEALQGVLLFALKFIPTMFG